MAYFQDHQNNAIFRKYHPVGAYAQPEHVGTFQPFNLIGEARWIGGVLINLGGDQLRLLPGDAR